MNTDPAARRYARSSRGIAASLVLVLAATTLPAAGDDDEAAAVPGQAPGSDSGAASGAAGEPQASADPDQPRFDIWEFAVAGNTLLEARLVEQAVYAHLGPERTIEHVEAARQALESAYRDAGYGTVLVDIPEQDVVNGVVELRVVQGEVERLRVTGSRYFSLGRIKAGAPSLAEGQVPYLPDVQQDLAQLNRATPDRRITPVLRPGRTPGKLEVELKVDDSLPLHAGVELNDRYSRDTERLRLNANVRYDNLWQREHSWSLAYQVAPQNRDNVEVFSSTYMFRIPDSNRIVTLYGVSTSSDVATVGTLGVVGEGTIAGVRGTLPLPALEGYFHSLTLGLDYKDFGESIELLGADSLNTPISYQMWSLIYNGTWIGERGDTEVSVSLNAAPRGLGNTEKEFENKRFQSKPNFIYMTVSLSRLQQWLLGSQLYGLVEGQVADSPLISNEQFSFGGVQSLRGYLESQVFVDDGLRATVELRSPSFGPRIWERLERLRVHGFVDAAHGRIQQPLPGQDLSFTLWSTGLGLRLGAFDGFDAELDWALPLKDSGDIEAGESRVHFSVGYDF